MCVCVRLLFRNFIVVTISFGTKSCWTRRATITWLIGTGGLRCMTYTTRSQIKQYNLPKKRISNEIFTLECSMLTYWKIISKNGYVRRINNSRPTKQRIPFFSKWRISLHERVDQWQATTRERYKQWMWISRGLHIMIDPACRMMMLYI